MLDELRQLIGLTNRNRFRITERVTNLKDDEISIQTRSVMAMMEFMARGVEVPLAYLEEGRVIDYGLQSSDGEEAQGLIPFKMRSSKNRPENVFAAVRFRDYWYYIAFYFVDPLPPRRLSIGCGPPEGANFRDRRKSFKYLSAAVIFRRTLPPAHAYRHAAK